MPLITIEGIDGAGKTRVIAYLAQWLKDVAGIEALVSSDFSSNVTVSKLLKPVMVSETNPHAQYATVMAARVTTARQWLRPLLSQRRLVIYDRYFDSTLAYQGSLGVNPSRIAEDHVALQLPIPEMTIILDLPVAVARARRGKPTDKIEQLNDSFFEVVRAAYIDSITMPGRHIVVDADRPFDEVAKDCVEAIRKRALPLLPNHNSYTTSTGAAA